MRVFPALIAIVGLLWPAAAEQTKSHPVSKTAHRRRRAKKPVPKSAAVAKKTTAGKSRSARAKRRRPAAMRQMAPTPERYQEIQQALAAKGYRGGSADGVWGPQWVEALKKFQQDQKLEPSGKLTSLSLLALGLGPKRDAAGAAVPAPRPNPPPEPPARENP